MDFNTILVVTVDGGLAIFFLYALYTIRSPNLAPRGVKKDLEVSAQEPIVTPLRGTNEEKHVIPEFNSRELFELEKEEPVPREYGLSEYKPKPAEPTTSEFDLPVFEPEPLEISSKKYGISELEPKPSSAQAQEDKSPRKRKRKLE